MGNKNLAFSNHICVAYIVFSSQGIYQRGTELPSFHRLWQMKSKCYKNLNRPSRMLEDSLIHLLNGLGLLVHHRLSEQHEFNAGAIRSDMLRLLIIENRKLQLVSL